MPVNADVRVQCAPCVWINLAMHVSGSLYTAIPFTVASPQRGLRGNMKKKTFTSLFMRWLVNFSVALFWSTIYSLLNVFLTKAIFLFVDFFSRE